MYDIMFKYRDKYTNGKWNTQTCTCESVAKCIEFYGLGKDCEYEIVSCKEANKFDKDMFIDLLREQQEQM